MDVHFSFFSCRSLAMLIFAALLFGDAGAQQKLDGSNAEPVSFTPQVNDEALDKRLREFQNLEGPLIKRSRQPGFTGFGAETIKVTPGSKAEHLGLQKGGLISHANGKPIRTHADMVRKTETELTYFDLEGNMQKIMAPAGMIGSSYRLVGESGPGFFLKPHGNPDIGVLLLAANDWIWIEPDLAESALARAQKQGFQGPLERAFMAQLTLRRKGPLAARAHLDHIPEPAIKGLPLGIQRWIYFIALAAGDIDLMDKMTTETSTFHSLSLGQPAKGPSTMAALQGFRARALLEERPQPIARIRKQGEPIDRYQDFRGLVPDPIFDATGAGPKRIDLRKEIASREYAAEQAKKGKPFSGASFAGSFTKFNLLIPAEKSLNIEFRVRFRIEAIGNDPQYDPITRIALIDGGWGQSYLDIAFHRASSHMAFFRHGTGFTTPLALPFDGSEHELTLRVFGDRSEIILDDVRILSLFNEGFKERQLSIRHLIPQFHLSGSRIDVLEMDINQLVRE